MTWDLALKGVGNWIINSYWYLGIWFLLLYFLCIQLCIAMISMTSELLMEWSLHYGWVSKKLPYSSTEPSRDGVGKIYSKELLHATMEAWSASVFSNTSDWLDGTHYTIESNLCSPNPLVSMLLTPKDAVTETCKIMFDWISSVIAQPSWDI